MSHLSLSWYVDMCLRFRAKKTFHWNSHFEMQAQKKCFQIIEGKKNKNPLRKFYLSA